MILIVPILNRPEYTEVCLEKIYTTNPGLKVRPIIVDNGSRPKTARIIDRFASATSSTEQVECANLIRFENNRGLAGSVNAGIDRIKSWGCGPDELVCVMHNDCYPFVGWAKELELALDDDEDAALAIPRTNYANEHSPCVPELREKFLRDKPSNKDRIEVVQIRKTLNVLYPNGEEAVLNMLKKNTFRTTYSPEPSSFCLLTRLSFLTKFNGWEECFYPCFFEDKFWALQLARLGFVCVVSNYSYVHHFGNITSDGPGYCFPDMFSANSLKFRNKLNELDAAGPKKEKA